jgi:hypothetical protein
VPALRLAGYQHLQKITLVNKRRQKPGITGLFLLGKINSFFTAEARRRRDENHDFLKKL